MNIYKVLNNQLYSYKDYSIVPIRYKDRMDILKWRNEQMYHLRQDKPLSEIDQENYFNNIINKLYSEDKPSQLLFSFLKDKICIGYGGLVHINWIDKNAEISFIMNTKLEKENFSTYWKIFLKLIEQVAFNELIFHKIYTYAFDIRPNIYASIEAAGFIKEAILKQHFFSTGEYKDIIIHTKFNHLHKL